MDRVAESLLYRGQQGYAARTDRLQFSLALPVVAGLESGRKGIFQREEGEERTDYTVRIEMEAAGYEEREGAIGAGGMDC